MTTPLTPRRWSNLSASNLAGVHPDLRRVFDAALQRTPFDLRVTEGLRSLARQEALVAAGLSRTMNSRHLTGHAVDVVPLWDADADGVLTTAELYNWRAYHQIAPVIKQVAKELGVPIEWGGDWKSFKDGPHWQLPFKSYPK